MLAPPASAPHGYTLAPDDVLQVSVWKDQDLTRQVVVGPDGLVSMPLIGEVKAGGLTAGELREELGRRLGEYMPDVRVSVALLKADSFKVYVLGQVNKPGEFAVRPQATVMQALAMAGGLTPFASARRIAILRQDGERQVAIGFDYQEVSRGRGLEGNITLRRGDVVVVP